MSQLHLTEIGRVAIPSTDQEAALEFCQRKVRDDITMLALRVGEPPGPRS